MTSPLPGDFARERVLWLRAEANELADALAELARLIGASRTFADDDLRDCHAPVKDSHLVDGYRVGAGAGRRAT